MPKRYICRECKEVYSKKRECKICEGETEEIDFDINIWSLFPYIMAGFAGVFLMSAYIFNIPILIWMTFPFIIIGVLADSYYQKRVDDRARKIIRSSE